MGEWKEYKLGEVAKVQTGPFGSQLHNKDYVLEGTPIVTVEHLGAREFTTQNLPKVSDADKKRLDKYTLREGDIVFSRVGSVDRCSFVSSKEVGWMFSGRCLRVRCEDGITPMFLYYFLQQEEVKQSIRNIAVGATMPSINTKLLSELDVLLPHLGTQQRIASVLSSLDDKIEVNRRINENLEQQAQALFKSWFVDFEPFKDGEFVESELGMIPKGWRVETIEALSEKMASGGTPKSMNKEYYSGDIKWFSTKELKDCFLFDSEKHISIDALNNSAAKMFPKDTVLMAIYAAPTVGRLGILSQEGAFNQAAVGIIPKRNIGKVFIYLTLLSERDNLNNLASGAAQQNLNVGIVKNHKILLPEQSVLDGFNMKVNPLFNTIEIKQRESRRLAELRDTLLPKLMSGELKV